MFKRAASLIKHPPLWLLLGLALVIAVGATRMQQQLAGQGKVTIGFTDLTSLNASDYLTNTQGPILIFATSGSADSNGEEVILSQSLGKYAGKVTFLRLDIKGSADVASALGVTADRTPTLLLVEVKPGGGLTALNQSTGLVDAESAQQFMDTGLSKAAPSTAAN